MSVAAVLSTASVAFEKLAARRFCSEQHKGIRVLMRNSQHAQSTTHAFEDTSDHAVKIVTSPSHCDSAQVQGEDGVLEETEATRTDHNCDAVG